MRALLVDVESTERYQLVQFLRRSHFRVVVASDFDSGLDIGAKVAVEIAVLNLFVPRGGELILDYRAAGASMHRLTRSRTNAGKELLRRWRRKRTSFPVLVHTLADDKKTVVEALESGADGYVVKGTDFEVLVAQMRAIVRRWGGWTSDRLYCPPIGLNLRARQVTVDEKPVELTGDQYLIVEYLMLRADSLVSNREIEEYVHFGGHPPPFESLHVQIHHIRGKINELCGRGLIENARGLGYCIPCTGRT